VAAAAIILGEAKGERNGGAAREVTGAISYGIAFSYGRLARAASISVKVAAADFYGLAVNSHRGLVTKYDRIASSCRDRRRSRPENRLAGPTAQWPVSPLQKRPSDASEHQCRIFSRFCVEPSLDNSVLPALLPLPELTGEIPPPPLSPIALCTLRKPALARCRVLWGARCHFALGQPTVHSLRLCNDQPRLSVIDDPGRLAVGARPLQPQ